MNCKNYTNGGEKMYRITKKMLENRVMHLNELTNNPTRIWENGQANVGNYHLDNAYGGYTLYRNMNIDGGVTNIFESGYVSMRVLFDLIGAFMEGYQAKAREGNDNE